MAIARCVNCGRPVGRLGNTYSNVLHYAMNHPNSGVVCGKNDCENAPVIWLLEREEEAYQRGQRVFLLTGGNRMAKFRVQ
jgi:hypothetical protein